MPLDYQKDYPQGMVALDDPTTLLLPDNDRNNKDWRLKFLFPVVGGLFIGTYPVLKNWFAGVPARTGIWQYPLWISIGVVTGKLVEDFRDYIMSERDAHYRQYIRQHPEDFQPEPLEARKKVGDLLKPWVPIR